MSTIVQLEDAAYEIARGLMEDGKASERLSEKFPDFAPDIITNTYRRARELYLAAYHLCADCRDKKVRQRDIEPELRRRCPGFSDSTYKTVISGCMYESLW